MQFASNNNPKTRVKNARRLVRKLRNIPIRMRSELTKVIENGAQQVAETMRQRTPVSALPGDRGHLRDQVRWAVANNSLRARIGFWGPVYRKFFFYARYLEYGTKKMLKRPFVRPALVVHGQQILGDIEEKTTDVLVAVAMSRPPDT